MPLPNINIIFREQGITAIKRSEKGTVAAILRDGIVERETYTLTNVTQIPAGLSTANKEYLMDIFRGYVNPPRRVLVCVDPDDAPISSGLNYFETMHFDYLVGPPDMDSTDANAVALWVKSERLNARTSKAVLANVAADHEGIVNFTTDDIKVGEKPKETTEYCGRIAGLIAGTPMAISCTYAPLPEVSDVERFTKDEMDSAIDRGEFIIFHDGEKVKVARGVNSLVTTSQDKGESFKKIKIVEVMDMMQNDIRKTAQDSYIGKYANSYDNKCLLIMAIKGYLEELERTSLLQRGYSTVGINMEKQINYLTGKGIDVSEMTEQQIKEADTGSTVFLLITVRILDAIEDIDIEVYI